MASASAHQSAFSEPASHPSLDYKSCPTCGQDIPPDKLEEIGGKIAAKEREQTLKITSQLEKQYAAERERLDAKAKADLESERQQSAIRETRAREEAQKAAEKLISVKLAEVEQRHANLAAGWQQQLVAAQSAQQLADQQTKALALQLDEVRHSNEAQVTKIKEEAAAEVLRAKQTAAEEAETRFRDNLKTNETALAEANARVSEAEAKVITLTEQQASAIEASLKAQREILEKAKDDEVNAEKARAFKENQKLTDKVADLQRTLDNKTAEELGEGAEIKLFDALKKEFPKDDIHRVTKGSQGADIIHVVMHCGKKCGTIIYDSKDHDQFRTEHVSKLRADQLAEGAEHSILATRKLPRGKRQLHLQDGVLLANPARVVAVATLIRQHLIQLHSLRVSNIEREKKKAALYDFIVSERCSSLLARIDERADSLLEEQKKEITWHENKWKREGTAIRAIQKAKADLENQVNLIIGTSESNAAA